jgi:uracil-DNA glycosylase family 4
MPETGNDIREKYLERAIRELNTLGRELQSCRGCAESGVMPVLGSGHPQADIALVKFSPTTSEIEEGVAFYGRVGSALSSSFARLNIDPMAVYGTVFQKCPDPDGFGPDPDCLGRVAFELDIVQPRILVVMGDRALESVNDLDYPLSRTVEPSPGEIQAFTPACDALFTPDIDDSLDEEGAKREFWRAFRVLGTWYDDLPPY